MISTDTDKHRGRERNSERARPQRMACVHWSGQPCNQKWH